MGPDHVGAAQHRRRGRGERARQPSRGIALAGQGADETTCARRRRRSGARARAADRVRPAPATSHSCHAMPLRRRSRSPDRPRCASGGIPARRASAKLSARRALTTSTGSPGPDDGWSTAAGPPATAPRPVGHHRDEAGSRPEPRPPPDRRHPEPRHVIDDPRARLEGRARGHAAARIGGDGNLDLARQETHGRAEAVGLLVPRRSGRSR